MPLKLELGDIVQMKKMHPCGNNRWEITRTGADIRIKCMKCERQVLMSRENFEKRVKKLIPKEEYRE
ncbi:MAG: protein involved in chromosome partitioning [Firmicutes bacterium]|nr:protein involved in chromosome partitioning [Bacillota bacterium]MDI6705001.1 DUF951 domain-containing protein [Bacillota bacterium]